MKRMCQLKDCLNVLGPGAAEVGYEIDGKLYELKLCAEHTGYIMTAPRGTWVITKDRELKPIPARFFVQHIKKGKP